MNNQVIYLFLIACIIGCESSVPDTASIKQDIIVQQNLDVSNFDKEKEDLAESVGTQAYLFGASIMTQIYFRNKMLKMVEMSKNPKSPMKFSKAADDGLHFNELIHTLNLANHKMKIGGTPNVDTRYSIIFFNLQHGAQVLTVPAIKNRYFSINITDAYLGNLPYICSRKGDVNGGKYLFTGPEFKGEIPGGVTEIKMPQNNFLVVVRIFVQDRNADNEIVTGIQNQFSLTNLDNYKGKVDKDKLIPVESVPLKEGTEYFQQMVDFMRENPPEGHQEFIWNMFRQVGMTNERTIDISDMEVPTIRGLEKGIEKGKNIIQWKARKRGDQTDSGWYYSLTMGVDHEDYMHRSEWAVQGLTVGSPIEAMFFNIFTDSDGKNLDGNNSYIIHIPADKMPPVNEFWSITSYGEDFNLVPNDELHYGVGIRNKREMTFNEDGSLTFKVQSKKPAEGNWNWIPTPESGPFKLNFRFYNPKEVMFDKEKINEYLPALERVELKD